MAGSKTDYMEGKMLDHVFGATLYVPPVTLYIALFTATPGETTPGTEVAGGSYARVAVTNNVGNWPNATLGAPSAKHNGALVTFVAATGVWGTVTSFGVFDALAAGNLLYFGDLTVPTAVGIGDTASFAISAITITED